MIFMTLLFLGSREISGDATIANKESVNVENVDVVADKMNISDSGMTSITVQGNLLGTVEKNSSTIRVLRQESKDLIVDEFLSTVPGKDFDLCIILTRTKTHKPFRKIIHIE